MIRAILIFLLVAAISPAALGHEVRPAYLELRQSSAETYDMLWKVPALAARG